MHISTPSNSELTTKCSSPADALCMLSMDSYLYLALVNFNGVVICQYFANDAKENIKSIAILLDVLYMRLIGIFIFDLDQF